MIRLIELKIDPEFRDKIHPLTEDEFKQLRENIINDGEVYEPICVWNGTIIDGHNRWVIIQEFPNVPFKIKEMQFADKDEAIDWMIKKQLGRRNLTPEERELLMGQMYLGRKKRAGAPIGNQNASKNNVPNLGTLKPTGRIGEQLANELGVGHGTITRAGDFASGIAALKEVSSEAAQKILAGNSKTTRQSVRDLAKSSKDEVEEFAMAVVKGEKPKTRNKANPNIDPIEKKQYDRPNDESRKQLAEIVKLREEQTSGTAEYGIEALLCEIELGGQNYVSTLRSVLTLRSTLLVNENRTKVNDLISNIIKNIEKIKELLT